MIDVTYFTGFIFVFIRMISFFGIVNIFFPIGFPNKAKVGFAVIMSFMLLPGINQTGLAVNNNLELIITIGSEITTGITLGFLTNLCFNAIKFAGQIIDTEVGFGMISIFDPTTSSNATFIENMLYWFSIMLFFITDTHHVLISELVKSFQVVEIGEFILSPKSSTVILNIFIQYFAIGLKISIPIVFIILITDLTMGLIARTVPSLNVMILGLPIKIVLGLMCISLALPIFADEIISNFNSFPQIFKGIYKVIPFIFIFASDDKSEEATAKKKQDARKKGQVAKSKEINLTATLLASTLVIAALGNYMKDNLGRFLLDFYTNYLNSTLSYSSISHIAIIAVTRIGLVLLPFIIPIMALGVISSLAQTGFLLSAESIKPSLSKINPLKGFKKMFSMRSFVELFKNLAIVSVVGFVGYKYIYSNFSSLLYMGDVGVPSMLELFKKLVVGIFTQTIYVLIAISIIDYIFQRRSYNKDLKMSKQEVKEEYKQQEGDPQVKGKIRQKQREMASRRMMSEVPNATVIVTNPTHLAIALKYEEGKSEAPIVVAKGADLVAFKIREIAKENDVPIIENKPLARLIYKEVELEQEIPAQMYQAIAEILALVFKMKKRK
ncbi:MAG: fused FliR family export protein/FlhB family type III secretion system protein [Clostridiaceae bacterium]|nr:fused FliR family export protein/FlhB family type III secretion system protein [Clostridiaceae bacterium]